MHDLSNQIYERIQRQIKIVVQKLTEQSAPESLSADISCALDNLNKLNNQIQAELEKLKEFSEWKRFTIAFYGETNAGKSTLIEALRLLLKEPSKQESQRKFKELQRQSGLTQASFDEVRRVIRDSETAISTVEDELNLLRKKFAESRNQAEMEVQRLIDLVQEIKEKHTWWNKILAWFSKMPEEKQLFEAQGRLNDSIREQEKEENGCESRLKALTDQRQEAVREKARLDGEVSRLAEFADGQIIGDGRSDFTRRNTVFDFDLNGRQFSLIDVPGIEGDEGVVSKPIEEAVRKAHAVFYVTRTARPPQTHDGEKNKKGTLEKIKAHLGAQTEVWSIYNHPVNNPRQLTSPLLNEDGSNSLLAMDEKLRAELKEQYCGSMVISARPAYLALTECVVPGGRENAERQKFLEKFGDSQTVLRLSGLADFVSRLQNTIIDDYKGKIYRSNLNKAYKALEKSLTELSQLQIRFIKAEKEFTNEIDNAESQIKTALEEFVGSLDAENSRIRIRFQDKVRDQVYSEIENDIGNNDFKQILEAAMEREAKGISGVIKQRIEQEADAFVERVKNIIKRSDHHLKNIVAMQSAGLDLKGDFKIDINIDNGLKLGGMLASGVGAALGVAFLFSNPAGWTLAFIGGILGLLGSFVGLVKAVWGWFDSDYKKSQQRKATDAALRKIGDSIDIEIKKVIKQIRREIKNEIQKMQSELEVPIIQCRAISNSLKRANKELSDIARNIKPKLERKHHV